MLSSARTREPAVSPPRLRRALFAVALALGCTQCVWLDDFDKFKIGDAGTLDAQTGQPRSDATTDATTDAASGDLCRNVSCGAMDAECMRGTCDPHC